jgi:hypothetical protein
MQKFLIDSEIKGFFANDKLPVGSYTGLSGRIFNLPL